jgi:small subunit ribosomal protein S1
MEEPKEIQESNTDNESPEPGKTQPEDNTDIDTESQNNVEDNDAENNDAETDVTESNVSESTESDSGESTVDEQTEEVSSEETVEKTDEPAEEVIEEGTADNDEPPNDEFAKLMEEYDLKAATSFSRIDGKIIEILGNKIIIDIGQKTEGILPKEELLDWDGSLKYNIGDTLTVMTKNVNSKEGYITVSKKQVDKEDGWQNIKKAYEKKEILTGKITGLINDNKGFIVDMGVDMFLPMSQADIRKIKSPKSWIGKQYEFRVTRINSKEKNGVVSRRTILEEERELKVKELFESLQVGDDVKGRVTSLTEYGAFVDIGGMDGLIHKDNISYARVNHPKEKLRKGDEVEAQILEMDAENNRISLGIKQRFPDPWVSIEDKYPVGTKLIAKVTKIVSFGAFIELEEGVEGLLHISDLTWEGKTNSVEEFVAVGERLWVQVIEVSAEEKKIKLGLKQLEMRPEEKYIQNHTTGEIIDGIVKKILKSRVFIELEKGVEGVVKISDITYFRIDTPHEYLKEKQKVQAMILSETLDTNYKVKLGLKQLSDGEWRQYINENRPGSIVMVKVKKVTDKGMSVEISKDIEGFIRPNDLTEERNVDIEVLEKMFEPGQEIEALVVSSDFERKRIYLSIRALKRKKEREEIDKYSKSSSDSITTVGDLFENAIDKKNK